MDGWMQNLVFQSLSERLRPNRDANLYLCSVGVVLRRCAHGEVYSISQKPTLQKSEIIIRRILPPLVDTCQGYFSF
jgi:hypothetical protein